VIDRALTKSITTDFSAADIDDPPISTSDLRQPTQISSTSIEQTPVHGETGESPAFIPLIPDHEHSKPYRDISKEA
jgi:hypothetical protein